MEYGQIQTEPHLHSDGLMVNQVRCKQRAVALLFVLEIVICEL